MSGFFYLYFQVNPPADFATPLQQLAILLEFIPISFVIFFKPNHSFIKLPSLSNCKTYFSGLDPTCPIQLDLSFLNKYSVMLVNTVFFDTPKKDAHLLS